MKRTKVKALIVLAVMLLVLSFIGGALMFTNAKYVSKDDGKVSTSVAHWNFEVTGTDTFNARDNLKGLKLAQVCTPATLVNGKLAPGTSGSFTITVSTRGTEVGANYGIVFDNFSNNFPTNLKFYVDGTAYNLSSGFTGTINANDINNQTKTHTVTWDWPYETGDATVNDPIDTNNGINNKDISFDITVTATQAMPVAQ